MWHSAIFSEVISRTQGAVGRLAVLFVILAAVGAAQSAGLISVEEALETAFPGADFKRETVFLTDAQMDKVERNAGERPRSALTTRFRAQTGQTTIGWAYLDTHRVRTLPETVMVIISPSRSVRRVEVVSFREPLDYLPPESWYGQFEGHELDEDLELKRAIRPITGATLTARATTDAVRRILAIHVALQESEGQP
mgnify:CR=1 FL=1